MKAFEQLKESVYPNTEEHANLVKTWQNAFDKFQKSIRKGKQNGQ